MATANPMEDATFGIKVHFYSSFRATPISSVGRLKVALDVLWQYRIDRELEHNDSGPGLAPFLYNNYARNHGT